MNDKFISALQTHKRGSQYFVIKGARPRGLRVDNYQVLRSKCVLHDGFLDIMYTSVINVFPHSFQL